MNKKQQDQKLSDWLQRHKGLLLRVTRSFAATSHDRDDLLQEVVLQVWRSIPRYTSKVAESTWIYRVALYTAVSWTRKESKHNDVRNEFTGEPVADAPAADPRVDWLYEKIAELDPIDRSLALLMLDGLSYREISDTLGLSENNVGVRLNRIRKQLTAKLDREGRHEL
ncbi:MAG: RNA polymerase sigma factor [Fuerstiella sp.]